MSVDNLPLVVAASAFLLDSLIGDPYWMPHPIRLFGSAISLFERCLNRGPRRVLKGATTWVVLVTSSYLLFFIVDHLLAPYPIYWAIFTTITIFWGLSSRCLIVEGLKVERILNRGDIEGARVQLGMIVGRDTSRLSAAQIRSAVIETIAENLSDGTVAPLFFLAIGGAPLMICYKMVNTLDSMVGYKSDRYLLFGRIPARMDDVANYIPARITALLMVVVSFSLRAAKFVVKYGNRHSSPNAGYPEAAIAGILDCRLGGPNVYFGKVVEKPYIGERAKELSHRDLIKSCWVNAKVALLAYIIVLSLIYFI